MCCRDARGKRNPLTFNGGKKREVRKMRNTSVWGGTSTGKLPFCVAFTCDVAAASTKKNKNKDRNEPRVDWRLLPNLTLKALAENRLEPMEMIRDS